MSGAVGRDRTDERAVVHVVLRASRARTAARAPRRHQDLAKALASGTPAQAAAAMRQHVRWSRREALERLKPYFELRKSSGRTFSRSAKRVFH